MPTQQGMNGLYSRCGRDDTPCVFVPPESEKTRTPKGMGEISKCSRRAEKPVSGSGNSGKRGSKMAGRSHSKDDKRKCSRIRNMWHYGTIDNEPIIGRNTRSDDGFSISNGKFVKGVRPMIARYIHCLLYTSIFLIRQFKNLFKI